MKRIVAIIISVAAAGSLLFAPLTAQAQKASNEKIQKAIIQLENDWAAALLKADVAATGRIEADDWTLADDSGKLFTKAQADGDLKDGTYKTTSYVNTELKVRVFGDTAVVSGLETEKSTYKGKDSSGTFRFTDVFVLRKGTWQAVATHVSKVAKE